MNQLIAESKDGKLEYSKTQETEILSILGNGKVLLSYTKWHGKPTRAQLGYYFAGMVKRKEILEHYGYTADEMYAKLIEHCGKEEVVDKNGVIEYLPITVSHRNKMQMMSLIDRCIKFLAEEGIYVDTPDEYFQKLIETKKPE